MSCQYGSPKKMTVSQLKDLAVGKHKEVAYSCTSAGSGGTMKYCPSNGEFDAIDTGTACAYDSLKNDGREFWCGSRDKTYAGCGNLFGDPKWVGHCEIIGNVTGCRRKSFSADASKCCLSGGKDIIYDERLNKSSEWAKPVQLLPYTSFANTIENTKRLAEREAEKARYYNSAKTCHPDYRSPTSPKCANIIENHCKNNTNPNYDTACKAYMGQGKAQRDRIMNAYCSRSNNIFNDRGCRSWALAASANDNVVGNLMRTKCSAANLGKEPCLSWVRNRSKHDSSMDSRMVEYCRLNPNNSKCVCINSPKNNKREGEFGFAGYPQCTDQKCATSQESAFLTYNMHNVKCDFQECKQWVESGIQVGMTNSVIANLEMNCGPTHASNSVNETVNDVSGGITAGQTASSGSYEAAKEAKRQAELQQQEEAKQAELNRQYAFAQQQAEAERKEKIMIILIIIIAIAAGIYLWSDDSANINGHQMYGQPMNSPVQMYG